MKTRILLVSILLIVLTNHVGAFLGAGTQDDKSVERALSFLSIYDFDPLTSLISDHLDKHADLLGEIKTKRFELRFSYANNYRAMNILVNVYERLPTFSVFQSVFLAELTLYLLSFWILIISLRAYYKRSWSAYLYILIISALPVLASAHPLSLYSAGYSWPITAPRGSVLILFVASLFFWHKNRAKKHSKVFILAIAMFSWSIHQATFLLFFVPGTVLFLLIKALSSRSTALYERTATWQILLVFNLAWISIGVISYGFLNSLEANDLQLNPRIVPIAIFINIVIFLWSQSKFQHKLLTNEKSAPLSELGVYLIVFSIIYLGMNLPFFADRTLMTRIYAINVYFEIARRLSGVIHILSWLILGQYFIGKYAVPNKTKMQVRLNGYLILSFAIASTLFAIGYLRLNGFTNLSFTTPAKLLTFISLATLWIIADKQSKGTLESKYLSLLLLPIFLIFSISSVGVYRSFKRGIQVVLNEQIQTIQISDLLNQPDVSAYDSEVLYYHAIANELKSKYIEDVSNR